MLFENLVQALRNKVEKIFKQLVLRQGNLNYRVIMPLQESDGYRDMRETRLSFFSRQLLS